MICPEDPENFGFESIILASGSLTRQRMLTSAGVAFRAVVAAIDEREIEENARMVGVAPDEIALTLAKAKARDVSLRWPGKLVVGADQTLSCAGELFHKPENIRAAAAQLRALSGKTHILCSAVSAYRDGDLLFEAAHDARMTMRRLSESFIQTYLDDDGASAVHSVGAYRIEKSGIQLFDLIDGDFFVILGLPLLPLLAFLRSAGLLRN